MLTFALIFFSLGTGYLIADFQCKGHLWRLYIQRVKRFQSKTIPVKQSGYYGVLTTLLNEQNDEGLDAFVGSMEVTAETLDVHFALGSLLRRRGEYARAVRIHENLLTRPSLPPESLHQVQLELAIDYWRSGLLDRAESILSELIDAAGIKQPTRWQASAYLLEIYQELGQWLEAIDIADRLTEKKFASEADLWRTLQAQFSCELAQQALDEDNYDLTLSKARKALSYDPECVRANLLLTEHALRTKDSQRALTHLVHIQKQHSHYLSETLKPLQHCFPSGDDAYLDYLLEMAQEKLSIPVMLTLTQSSLRDSRALFIASLWKQVIQASDRNTLPEAELLLLILENLDEKNAILRVESVANYLQSKLHYVCRACGAEYVNMQWQCVSCGAWSTIKMNLI